jgi:hypothetical protein
MNKKSNSWAVFSLGCIQKASFRVSVRANVTFSWVSSFFSKICLERGYEHSFPHVFRKLYRNFINDHVSGGNFTSNYVFLLVYFIEWGYSCRLFRTGRKTVFGPKDSNTLVKLHSEEYIIFSGHQIISRLIR